MYKPSGRSSPDLPDGFFYSFQLLHDAVYGLPRPLTNLKPSSMLRFTLFRIPIEIQPWFWVTGALIGGAFQTSTKEDLFRVIVFVVVMTISILVHELGHALSGRKLGGGQPAITLWAFGGFATNSGGRFTASQRFWMIFMGPGAGFALLALVILALITIFGVQGGLSLASFAAFGGTGIPPTAEVIAFVEPNSPRWWVVRGFIWINLWWGLLNLLPVLPLDGGQIAAIWIKPATRALMLSAVTAAAIAVLGYAVFNSLYMALLFGFLAYRSFKDYQSSAVR